VIEDQAGIEKRERRVSRNEPEQPGNKRSFEWPCATGSVGERVGITVGARAGKVREGPERGSQLGFRSGHRKPLDVYTQAQLHKPQISPPRLVGLTTQLRLQTPQPIRIPSHVSVICTYSKEVYENQNAEKNLFGIY